MFWWFVVQRYSVSYEDDVLQLNDPMMSASSITTDTHCFLEDFEGEGLLSLFLLTAIHDGRRSSGRHRHTQC